MSTPGPRKLRGDSRAPVAAVTDHVVEQAFPGAPGAPNLELRDRAANKRQGARRSALLKVQAGAVAWEPRRGLPAGGRDECRTGPRPCPHVTCRDNLLRVDGADRPGHRFDGRPPPTVVREPDPGQPSCARDFYDGRERDFGEVGRIVGVGKRRAQQIAKAALEKLRQAGTGLDLLVGA
jgi:hypothetical protein